MDLGPSSFGSPSEAEAEDAAAAQEEAMAAFRAYPELPKGLHEGTILKLYPEAQNGSI